MRLFSDTAFLTVSRSREDSSPNTIRPLQPTTRIPSLVRVASFSCMDTPLPPTSNSVGIRAAPAFRVDALAYRLRPGFSKLGLRRLRHGGIVVWLTGPSTGGSPVCNGDHF